MRILALSGNYPHKDDPTCGIFAARQFAEMKKQGADICVVSPAAKAPNLLSRHSKYKAFKPRTLLSFDQLDAHLAGFYRLPGKYALLFDGRLAIWSNKHLFSRLHHKYNFTLIYARGFSLEVDIGLRLGKAWDIPVVGVGIGSDVNVRPTFGPLFQRRFIRMAEQLDMIISTGQGVADKIIAATQRKVTVLAGVVNLDEFTPVTNKAQMRLKLQLPLKHQIILYAGHIIRTKGLYELVEAFQNILPSYPNTLLILCGDGKDRNAILSIIQQHNLSNNILSPGNIPPEQMSQWMQAADVFVLPSHREGMPNSIMEAMACGLPVIASNVGGIPAALSDCEGAILINPESTREIEQALLRLLSNQYLCLKMGESARLLAESKFNITTNTKAMLQLFGNLIDNKQAINSSPNIIK